jgi:hypothetical protein
LALRSSKEVKPIPRRVAQSPTSSGSIWISALTKARPSATEQASLMYGLVLSAFSILAG